MPRVHALLAAAALLFGHSAEHRPLTATRVGEGPAKVLVVGLDPRQRDGGARRGARACGARAPPAGRGAVAGRLRQPRRRAARHAPERARGRSQPQLRPPLARRRAAAFDTYFPGRARVLRAGVAGGAAAGAADPARRHRLVPPAPAARRTSSAGADARARARATPAASACPARTLPNYRGTATSWQNHAFAGTSSFVVELPAGPLPARVGEAARRRGAGGRRARWPRARPPRRRARASSRRRIPFGATRRAQMRAYARRHYGIDTAALRDPKVIVEHFTASGTFSSAFNTFAANAPDVELHERPGVCAHFVIDRDGTIYQLVSLRLDVPPHGRAQRRRDRDRARRLLRRRDPRPPGAAPRLAAAHALAPGAATGSAGATSSGTPRASRAPTTTSASRACARQTHGDFARRAMRRYRGRL